MADGDVIPAEVFSAMSGTNALRNRVNSLGTTVFGVADDMGDGLHWMVLAPRFKTSGQSLQMTLAPNGSPVAATLDVDHKLCTIGFLHADAALTAGVYCAVFSDRIVLGTFTREDVGPGTGSLTLPFTLPATFTTLVETFPSSGFTFTPFETWTADQPVGLSSRVEVKNTGTTFAVLLGDYPVIVGATLPAVLDSVNRNCAGVAIRRATFDGETKQDSPWVSFVAGSDYIPQTVVGSGAKMARTSTSAVAVTAGGTTLYPFPAGYFDATVRYTTDIVSIPVANSFTVSVTGWYEVKLNTGFIFSATNLGLCALMVNGDLYEYGNSSMASGMWVSSSWSLPLVSGNTISPAYLTTGSGSVSLIGGSAVAASAYFVVTLANTSIS